MPDGRGCVAELRGVRARAVAGPGEKATAAQHAWGKLTARERIGLLLVSAYELKCRAAYR
ncbi:hypothetical protein DMH12_38510 [Streptomyces sp. WAC 04229]|nr:hypothetical protein DMH12_38510 [Streptomyces sp. WAC 04229]